METGLFLGNTSRSLRVPIITREEPQEFLLAAREKPEILTSTGDETLFHVASQENPPAPQILEVLDTLDTALSEAGREGGISLKMSQRKGSHHQR